MNIIYVGLIVVGVLFPMKQKDELTTEYRYHEQRIPFDPIKSNIGDRACVAPASGSYEHHVWLMKEDFYRSSSCIFSVEKVREGWRLKTNGIPIGEIGSDSEFRRLGYIRVVEVSK